MGGGGVQTFLDLHSYGLASSVKGPVHAYNTNYEYIVIDN